MTYGSRLDQLVESTARGDPLLVTPEVYILLRRVPKEHVDLRFTPSQRPETQRRNFPSHLGRTSLRFKYAKNLLSALYSSLYHNQRRDYDSLCAYGRTGEFSSHLVECDVGEKHSWMYRAMTARSKQAAVSRRMGSAENELYSLTFAFDNGSKLFIAMLRGEVPEDIMQHLNIDKMRERVIDLLTSAGLAISNASNPPGQIVDLFTRTRDQVVQTMQ